MDIEGSTHQLDDFFPKEDFEAVRKALNAVTQRKNLGPGLAEMMKDRKGHMEVRANMVIFRKCVKELDGHVCDDCQAKPHSFPKEVIADLPKRDLGKGALWWDLTLDPNHPGEKHIHEAILTIFSRFFQDSV